MGPEVKLKVGGTKISKIEEKTKTIKPINLIKSLVEKLKSHTKWVVQSSDDTPGKEPAAHADQPAAGKNSKKFKKVQKSSKIDRSSESSDHTPGKDMKWGFQKLQGCRHWPPWLDMQHMLNSWAVKNMCGLDAGNKKNTANSHRCH